MVRKLGNGGTNRNYVLEENDDNVEIVDNFEPYFNDDFENVENSGNLLGLDYNEEGCENINENAEFEFIDDLEDMLDRKSVG